LGQSATRRQANNIADLRGRAFSLSPRMPTRMCPIDPCPVCPAFGLHPLKEGKVGNPRAAAVPASSIVAETTLARTNHGRRHRGRVPHS